MKKLAQVFGISPEYAMCLEQNGVPTVLELARTNDLAELSARAGVPLELLQQWHLLAQRQVSASPYRRKVVAITAVLMLGLLLIGLTVAFRSFHTAPRITPDSYAQAVELYQRKDYGGAARILDEALARGENTAALHNLRGILYRHASQLQAAISEYQEALAVDSAYAYAWRNLGNVYGDLKQTDQAITHYQKAVELKPQETGVRLILAGLWAQTGKLSEAEAEYKAAIAAAPDEIESYNELSALYRRWQKPDLAEQTLLRATEHNPQSDAALASLGRIYFDDERYAEAAKAYRRAAELNPKELSYWRQAGRAFRLTRDWDAALDVYRQIVEVDAADWEAHFYAGWVLLQKGEPFQQEAIAPLKAAVEAAPGDERNKWAYLNLAGAYAAKGAERDADAALYEALRVDANFVAALIELGYLHQVRGNYAQAEEFYKQAIYADSTDPDTTPAYYNLVSLYRMQSYFDRAQKTFDELQLLAPHDKYTQWLLAEERSRQEDFAGAAEIYRNILDSNPSDYDTLRNLAEAEIQAGQKSQNSQAVQEGIHKLEDAVRRNPTFADGYAMLGWTYHVIPLVRDLDKAKSFYQEGLKYDPRRLAILNNLANIALAEIDLQSIDELSRKILAINPQDQDGQDLLGTVKFLKADLRGALEAYKVALNIAPRHVDSLVMSSEILIWLGESAEAHQKLALARDNIAEDSTTLTRVLLVQYDSTEKQRLVYFYTLAQQKAMVELLDGLAYLREGEVSQALKHYQAATQQLTSSHEDQEVARKGINDLHRLWKEVPGQPVAEVCLGYLYDWLGDYELAVHHWRRYLEVGSDPAGIEEVRRGLGRYTRLQVQ